MAKKSQVGKKRSRAKETWRRMKKNSNSMIGLVLVILIIILALSAPLIYDYDTEVISQNINERLQGPSKKHIFGTDQYGRDILARIMYGARISLSIGAVSCLICCSLGVLLGAIAGFFGGAVDDVIMRFFDIMLAIPSTLLAIILVATFGASTFNIIIAVGLPTLPQYVRITRAQVMTVKAQDYVEAARAVGASDAATLLTGLGIPAPQPDWGGMLAEGRAFLRDYPYMVLFPGIAIMVTILALNMLGDGLRDSLDPKLKR